MNDFERFMHQAVGGSNGAPLKVRKDVSDQLKTHIVKSLVSCKVDNVRFFEFGLYIRAQGFNAIVENNFSQECSRFYTVSNEVLSEIAKSLGVVITPGIFGNFNLVKDCIFGSITRQLNNSLADAVVESDVLMAGLGFKFTPDEKGYVLVEINELTNETLAQQLQRL